MGIFVGSSFCLHIFYSANSADNSYNYSSFSWRKCNLISKKFTMGYCHLGALKFYIWKSPNWVSPLIAIPFSQLLYGRKDNIMAKNYPFFFLVAPHGNCVLHLWRQSLPIPWTHKGQARYLTSLVTPYQIYSPTNFLSYLNSSLSSSMSIIGLLTVLPENVDADTKMLLHSVFHCWIW